MNDEIKKLEIEAIEIPEQAKALRIVSNETYAQAGAMLVRVKTLRKKIQGVFKPMKQKQDEAKREILNQERAADAPLIETENILKPALAKWDSEQEAIRKSEEIRLNVLKQKQEEERKIEDARFLTDLGDEKAAEQVMTEPTAAPPVVVAKTVPKVTGISFTERWTFSIMDAMLVPREFLQPDEIKISKYVRTMKAAGRIPGVTIYSEKAVSSRG